MKIIPDRLNWRKRRIRSVERKILDKDDIFLINSKNEELHTRVSEGEMTIPHARELLRREVLSIVRSKTQMTDEELARTGIMKKMENFVDRKIKRSNVDGKTIERKNRRGIKSSQKEMLVGQLRMQISNNPKIRKEQALVFLKAYAKSQGYSKGLAKKVVIEEFEELEKNNFIGKKGELVSRSGSGELPPKLSEPSSKSIMNRAEQLGMKSKADEFKFNLTRWDKSSEDLKKDLEALLKEMREQFK